VARDTADAVAGLVNLKEEVMRSVILGTAIATGMSALAISAASAAPLARDGIVGQGLIEQVQYESRYCRRLRRACENKDIRGEVGEGNCRRYRRQCGGRR
jgi:hypothetical protein